MTRVLFLARNTVMHPNPGGMEVVLENLANALRPLGVELGLVTTTGFAPPRDSSFDRTWIVRKTRPGRYSMRWWLATGRGGEWDAWAPDIVIGIGDAAGAFIRGRRTSIPTVIQSHGTPVMEAVSAFRSRSARGFLQGVLNLTRWPSRRWFYSGATEIWAIGETVQASLREHMGLTTGVRLLPNTVPGADFAFDVASRASIRARLNIPMEARVGLYIGRLDRQKRVDLAIKATSVARSTIDHLLVVGDGHDRSRLEDCAASEGIADRVHFVGRVDRDLLGSFYSAGDVFFLPSSRSEGLPVSVLEAAASGLPLVASTTAGVPSEIVAKGPVALVSSASPVDWLHAAQSLQVPSPRERYLPSPYDGHGYGVRHLRRIESLVRKS